MSVRPNVYAKTANAAAAIAVSPVASPSSPSVRFTAFENPATTPVTKTTYSQGAKITTTYLKNGIVVPDSGIVSGGTAGQKRSVNPRATPKLQIGRASCRERV